MPRQEWGRAYWPAGGREGGEDRAGGWLADQSETGALVSHCEEEPWCPLHRTNQGSPIRRCPHRTYPHTTHRQQYMLGPARSSSTHEPADFVCIKAAPSPSPTLTVLAPMNPGELVIQYRRSASCMAYQQQAS